MQNFAKRIKKLEQKIEVRRLGDLERLKINSLADFSRIYLDKDFLNTLTEAEADYLNGQAEVFFRGLVSEPEGAGAIA